ncbi:unnamed protein product [Acanthoscelides obtectus]|uniref:Uncharacterized protein n=1 Tax=Acanthoscelides obtectus TaxID=200917 RepID=A0A9P0KF47_ACAOB|nr:unnamed protein product [Acanthoscelides obtectus]CAK1677207.1 Ras-related protein Rab-33B [Acanthoscelides obtectus]
MSTAGTSSRPSVNTSAMVESLRPTRKGRPFKVIVIGDPNVGKTTLTYRFCEGKFLEAAEATIGVEFRSKTVNIDGEDITLQLWDTAGQERHRASMIRHYYRNAHAIIFMYDVTNRDTFENLKRWIDESNQNCLDDIPRILVGNKCDGHSVIPTNETQHFADQYGMPVFETSACLESEKENIDSIFMTLAHKLKHQKLFLQKPPVSESNIKLGDPSNKRDKGKSCSC